MAKLIVKRIEDNIVEWIGDDSYCTWDSQLMASIMVEEKKLPMMVIYQMDLNVV
jgi:TPP-dependent trihydroxycyclohexane-1,2-dione (THcHDO) dehydratase